MTLKRKNDDDDINHFGRTAFVLDLAKSNCIKEC